MEVKGERTAVVEEKWRENKLLWSCEILEKRRGMGCLDDSFICIIRLPL